MKDSSSSSRSSIRRFILITLSHSESRGVSRDEILNRIIRTFVCQSVIVAQEMHHEEEKRNLKHPSLGRHFHVAVLNESASKNNATNIIRRLFPEFEGRQCHVAFHRTFATICKYVTKDDTAPLVWGKYSLQDILSFAQKQNKSKRCKASPEEIIQQLKECKQWLDVYQKPDLANQLLLRHSNLKKMHAELQIIQMQQASAAERILQYLLSKGDPQEYPPEILLEKYVLLDWIACQLAFHRPIKTKQLFVYGKPSTQKTLILHFLAKALRVYFASSRINDFTGADDFYDLWVFDEFHSSEGQIDNAQNDTQQQNTLLKVLDGQECRLDSKYRELFNKQRNAPIIMIANHMPWNLKQSGPMQERFLRLRFMSNIPVLQEERVIATLWGCLYRRINQHLALATQHDISIQYNSAYALFRDHHSLPNLLHLSFSQCEHEDSLATLSTSHVLNLFIKRNLLPEPSLSLIQFALVPLKKTSEDIQNSSIHVFMQNPEGAAFQIYRPKDDIHTLVWPLYAYKVHDKLSTTPHASPHPPGRPEALLVKLRLDPILEQSHLNLTPLHKEFLHKEQSYRTQGHMWKLQLGVPGNTNYHANWHEND